MRVGIVCYPTFGGSGAVATELGQALARKGHEVHMISYAPPFRLREFRPNLHFHVVEVSSYPLFRYPPYDLALASKIMEVVKAHGLDILHAHYAIPHAISAYLAREMLPEGKKIKVITTLHGTDITLLGSEKAYYEITRFGIERSDGVTVVSDWLRRETARIFKVERDLLVIPNFVDANRFRPGENPEYRARFAEPHERILVHASNFRPVKRISDVIRCFSLVREQVPTRLVLVGDGPELPGAVELASELGIRQHVVFTGQQEAVEELYRVADAFLLPSEFESFGLAALEALACGLPVGGTNTGGMGEVVDEGKNGHLCRVGDTTCMANFLVSLFIDPEKLSRFRKSARESVLARFTEDKVVGIYEDYYAKVLGE